MKLQDQVVLVTGGGGGLGEAIVCTLQVQVQRLSSIITKAKKK